MQLANDLIVPAIAVVGTFFYLGLDIRGHYWRGEINTHLAPRIREGLFRIIPSDLAVSDQERSTLLGPKTFGRLTGVFWEAIDQDEILRSHKGHFYANGLMYSTSIDVSLICPLIGAGYVGAFFAARDYWFLAFGVTLFLIAALSRVLITPRFRMRHQELLTEQLDLLRRRQAGFVGQRYREIIEEARRGEIDSKEPFVASEGREE